jgi:hypothetical protein
MVANAQNIYGYVPSLTLAIVALILFFISATLHGFQMYRSKRWFLIPLVVGGAFEVLGYIFRLISRASLGSVGLYALQTLFILLAPALFAASIYIVLGRLLVSLKASQVSWIPVKWMTRFFIIGDVLAFLSQCAGGGVQASASSSGNVQVQQEGADIVVTGLGIQVVFFSGYIITTVMCHWRLNKLNIPPSPGMRISWRTWHLKKLNIPLPAGVRISWRTMIYAIYAVSLLILIRCVFRMIEYQGGYNGPIMSHEVFSYCLDALPMLLVMVTLNVCHPSYAIARAKSPTLDVEL